MPPAGVIRPIRLAPLSVNQRLPSGPAVIPTGFVTAVVGKGDRGNSVTSPAGVIRPIRFPISSVNQRLPSGPAVIPFGLPPAVGTRNSVTTPCATAGAGISPVTVATRSPMVGIARPTHDWRTVMEPCFTSPPAWRRAQRESSFWARRFWMPFGHYLLAMSPSGADSAHP
jgi:hypothetical protein